MLTGSLCIEKLNCLKTNINEQFLLHDGLTSKGFRVIRVISERRAALKGRRLHGVCVSFAEYKNTLNCIFAIAAHFGHGVSN